MTGFEVPDLHATSGERGLIIRQEYCAVFLCCRSQQAYLQSGHRVTRGHETLVLGDRDVKHGVTASGTK
eukprot:6127246-Prymnesium_polylepis.1